MGQALTVCPLCGNTEPEPWFEQPMNETIRAYARSYISPVKEQFPSMEAALAHWGNDFNKEDYPE
jgi:hypothetical protein